MERPNAGMVSAWELQAGILLEDRPLLLPWGTPFDELCKLGSPDILRHENSIHPTWHECRVFGMQGDLGACRILEEPNPRAYHIYLAEFHWATLELQEVFARPHSAQRRMREIYQIISTETGTPASSYAKYQEGLPALMWHGANVDIHLGPSCRYDLVGRAHVLREVRLRVSVAHVPTGYDELKAERQRIREREGIGAELNYPAWNPEYD